jgi:hypothetical protein
MTVSPATTGDLSDTLPSTSSSFAKQTKGAKLLEACSEDLQAAICLSCFVERKVITGSLSNRQKGKECEITADENE